MIRRFAIVALRGCAVPFVLLSGLFDWIAGLFYRWAVGLEWGAGK
jgi:hypothetical protein